MKRILCLVLILFLGVPLSARAQGVSSVLNEQFNAMSTTTNPGVYMGARRGVITGGSMHVRSRVIRSAPLYQVTFPSLKTGGCGDIDAYGGSFSFIQGDAMTELLRQIASNAGTYAFSLALSSMCPSCAAKMEEWQKAIQNKTSWLQDSCLDAQRLVDGGIQAWASRQKSEQSVATGASDDSNDAQAQGLGEDERSTALSDDELKDIDPGNLIWNMMKRQDMGRWISNDTNDAVLMDIMSYTGSLIVCTSGRNGCTESQDHSVREGKTVTTPLPSILSLEELINGSSRASGNLLNRDLEVYRCNDTEVGGCLTVTPTPQPNYTGVSQRILTIITGGPYGIEASMIARARSGAAPLDSDLALMTHARSYTSMIVNLARRSEYAAKTFAEQFAGEIALEMTRNTMDQMLAGARKTALKLQGASGQEAVKILERARIKLWQETRDLKRSNASSATMLQYYLQLTQLMPPSELLPIPGGDGGVSQ